jgi:hypothetical protein
MNNQCPLCSKDNPESEWICESCGAKLPRHGEKAASVVASPETTDTPQEPMMLNVKTPEQAKFHIRGLSQKKIELQLKKRQVVAEIAAIRRVHRIQKVDNAPEVDMTGGRDRAALLDIAVTVDSDIDDLKLRQAEIDHNLVQCDKALLQLEQYLFSHPTD